MLVVINMFWNDTTVFQHRLYSEVHCVGPETRNPTSKTHPTRCVSESVNTKEIHNGGLRSIVLIKSRQIVCIKINVYIFYLVFVGVFYIKLAVFCHPLIDETIVTLDAK